MTNRNDDLHRSGLALGWLEETQPSRWSSRPYWIAALTLALLAGAMAYAIAWWFR